MNKKRFLFLIADALFDRLESFWDSRRFHMLVGYVLVIGFLGALLFIELQRQQLLPSSWAVFIPTNHFYAVAFAFNLLLIMEVISLVFSLVHSICDALGKQFEILSLILLRSSFKEFIHFSEPLVWNDLFQPVVHILSDAGGAFLLFIFLGFYYRIQKHYQITADEGDLKNFISAKKILALLLLTAFLVLGLYNFYDLLFHHGTHNFFATFYTILIFSDILLVLLSLRYTYNYYTLFRNSGFALTTVVIRLALTAPIYINILLGLSAALFALAITIAYNTFFQDYMKNKSQ